MLSCPFDTLTESLHLYKDLFRFDLCFMYLGKFLAKAGFCSRRKAVDLVKEGWISVNYQIVLDPACIISERDRVACGAKVINLKNSESFIYVMFNKPPYLMTTMSDEFGRQTVVDFLKEKGLEERAYPVGRLDYLSSGLLLLTNDGDWAFKMAHPKFEVVKVYRVLLNRALHEKDLVSLKAGLWLEDGFIKPDLVLLNPKMNGYEISIELHSGRNRIIRRIFEKLNYKVEELERTKFGSFELEGLRQGEWRYLHL